MKKVTWMNREDVNEVKETLDGLVFVFGREPLEVKDLIIGIDERDGEFRYIVGVNMVGDDWLVYDTTGFVEIEDGLTAKDLLFVDEEDVVGFAELVVEIFDDEDVEERLLVKVSGSVAEVERRTIESL